METVLTFIGAKLFLLLVLAALSIPVTMAVRRYMRPSRLKDALLDRTLVERKPGYAWLAIGLCVLIIVGGTVYYR